MVAFCTCYYSSPAVNAFGLWYVHVLAVKSRAEPSVEAHHRSVGPDTGRKIYKHKYSGVGFELFRYFRHRKEDENIPLTLLYSFSLQKGIAYLRLRVKTPLCSIHGWLNLGFEHELSQWRLLLCSEHNESGLAWIWNDELKCLFLRNCNFLNWDPNTTHKKMEGLDNLTNLSAPRQPEKDLAPYSSWLAFKHRHPSSTADLADV